MDAEFWHQRWRENQIGFHQEKVNSRLRKFWPGLGLPRGATVFVPLCGKSLDMLWLRGTGHRVLGVEISSDACAGFFRENGIAFERMVGDRFTRFVSDGIELFAGDFFALTAEDLDGVAAVYDRAALVALPTAMRSEYVTRLAGLLPGETPVLLISMSYDQTRMQGPPFSVDDDEVRRLYGGTFEITCIGQSSGPEIVGNLRQRGLQTLDEKVYRLVRTPADPG